MIDASYFLTITFILVRLSSFFIICKSFYPNGTPKTLKAFFALIMAVSITQGVENVTMDVINNNYILIIYLLNEVITGAILGLIINIIFDVISMAGNWIDVHIGLSMISMMDPNTQQQVTVSGKLLNYISLVLFFIVDGHHIFIKSLIETFNLVPLGKTIVYENSMMALIEIISEYFLIGLKIAIPIVLIIILTDICMGLISRVVPQINVMILGMPIKMFVGLLTISVALPIILKIVVSLFTYIPDIIRKIVSFVPVAFIFVADDKTEEATPKKKNEARKKGQIPRSKDVGLAIGMVTCTAMIMMFSGRLVNIMKDLIIYYVGNVSTIDITEMSLKAITFNTVMKFMTAVIPFIVPIMIGGIVASVMQTGLLLTGEPLKPSFSKLNPINGFKNMFSKRTFIDLAKNLLVVGVVVYIGYTYFVDNYSSLLQISNLYLPSMGIVIQDLIVGIFIKIVVVLGVLAAIDYFIQFRLHNDDLKMSKQEVKEEYKQVEGDPQIKSKIKQKQREMSQRRMMQSIGDATVVITNPTHIAVAIMYKEGEMEAPKLVAKGADAIAVKIKEVAKESNVPIVENKPLARMIYEKVELEEDIPQDMYQAIAEILVVIYKMKK